MDFSIVISKEHLNSNNTLFGGELMKWMDNLAHKSAINFSKSQAVTIRVNELVFHKPVFEGNKIQITSKLISVRGSIMEFEIDSFIVTKESKTVNASSTFFMSAINECGKPIRLRK